MLVVFVIIVVVVVVVVVLFPFLLLGGMRMKGSSTLEQNVGERAAVSLAEPWNVKGS